MSTFGSLEEFAERSRLEEPRVRRTLPRYVTADALKEYVTVEMLKEMNDNHLRLFDLQDEASKKQAERINELDAVVGKLVKEVRTALLELETKLEKVEQAVDDIFLPELEELAQEEAHLDAEVQEVAQEEAHLEAVEQELVQEVEHVAEEEHIAANPEMEQEYALERSLEQELEREAAADDEREFA